MVWAGGGILTVPALVYLLGHDALTATTSGMVIVGASVAFGLVSRTRRGGVDWRTTAVFGLVGVPATYVGSLLVARVDERGARPGRSGERGRRLLPAAAKVELAAVTVGS